MYYFRYFLKCCIRNVARLICKPKILFTLLAILLLLFCFGKIESFAVEIPEQYTNIDYSVKNDISLNVDTKQFISFGGFRCYYIPVREGQKFGYTFDSTSNFEIRTCYSETVPSVNLYAYSRGSISYGNHNAGFSLLEPDLVSPVDGYFCLFVYPTDALDVAFFDRDTVQDVVSNLGTSITQNQDKNTEDIINNNNDNTNKIIESQEQIEYSITSTDYDEESISIDTSALDDLSENEDILNYPMQLVQKLTDIVNGTNWNTVETIDIGIPFTDKKIQLKSDMLYNFIKDTAFYDLLYVFWVYIFGRYMIHFGLRIYHWLRTGEAVRKSFNIDGEAITAALM